jgi:hypothetical protein
VFHLGFGLDPPHLTCEVAALDQRLEESFVRITAEKVPAATHTQRLIDGRLEVKVGLFDVTILVGLTDVVDGGFHAVVSQ